MLKKIFFVIILFVSVFSVSDSFAYESKIEVRNALRQPVFSDPSLAFQEMYRFTVKVGDSVKANLGRISFRVVLGGMEAAEGGLKFAVKKINKYGLIDKRKVFSRISDTSLIKGENVAEVTVDFIVELFESGTFQTYGLFVGNTRNNVKKEKDDDIIAVSILNDRNCELSNVRKNLDNSKIIWADLSDSEYSDFNGWRNGFAVETDVIKLNYD